VPVKVEEIDSFGITIAFDNAQAISCPATAQSVPIAARGWRIRTIWDSPCGDRRVRHRCTLAGGDDLATGTCQERVF
jgi:hypothetical protein